MSDRDTFLGAGRLILALSLSGLLWPAVLSEAHAATDQTTGLDKEGCLRCHRMATLAYRDPQTGGIIDLSITPEPLAHSVHGKLECVECHEGDYGRYPHPDGLDSGALACVGCHEEQDDAEHRAYRFETIDAEFRRSIHVTSDAPEAQGFSCHRCHDPHRFRASEIGEAITMIVREDNQVCLSCHEQVRDPLSDPHAWLPRRDKHWEAVRCLDCHTPVSEDGQPVSHQILAAKDSNRDCVNCHSREARLLNRLYQYRSETDLATQGWISKAVFNEAYVVGMSRSPLIDRLSLLVIGITLLGLAAHGYGRYRAYQRSRENRT